MLKTSITKKDLHFNADISLEFTGQTTISDTIRSKTSRRKKLLTNRRKQKNLLQPLYSEEPLYIVIQ